jgi:hypothetical protein
MNMSKHTPGPWASHYHKTTDTYTIHVEGRSWESWAVAEVGFCTQDEANARLIAAAPELLAALETAIAPFAGISDENLLLDWQRNARAAIAKAKGE